MTTNEQPQGEGNRALLVLAAALLLTEYLVVSHLFDARSVAVRGGLWTWVSSVGEVGPPIVTTAAAWFAFFRLAPADRKRPARASDPSPVPRLPWLFAHIFCAALLLWVTQAMFGLRAAPKGSAMLWLLCWTLLVVATATSALLAVLGGARWLRVLATDLTAALPVGLLAWLLGLSSADLWRAYGSWTLDPVAAMLHTLTGHASADAPASLLHLQHWSMQVSPGCGGYEGFGILLALTASYTVRFRTSLRAQRVPWIVAAGLLSIWVTNLLRFALLGSLGNVLGPRVAVASFHSKASWVLFSGLALGTVLALRRFAKRPEPPR